MMISLGRNFVLFLLFLLILLLHSRLTTSQLDGNHNFEVEIDEPVDERIRKPKDSWTLHMVYNVQWNLSKAYMGVVRRKISEEPHLHLGRMPTGKYDPRGVDFDQGLWSDGEMSYFVGLEQPNMQIQFYADDDETAFCKVATIPDEVLNLVNNADRIKEYGDNNCQFKGKAYRFYDENMPDSELSRTRKYAFCPLDEYIRQQLPSVEFPKWVVANGTYHRPTQPVHCLYDFHTNARETTEYNLFSYCAKAYYYNGNDFNKQDERIRTIRKDWVLYLAEGRVTCSISGNMQADNDLLKKGYRVELIHNFDYYRYRFYDEMYYCPELRAKLAAYDDQRMDGRFFFGGLAGAGQLESGIVRSYWSDWDKKTDRPRAVGKKFWSSQTYRNEYESMNVDLKACYLHYHNLAQRYWRSVTRDQSEKQSRRYNLQIRVLHFCTERGMRESIKFDVAIGPDQVPEGVYEDKGILIELDKKRLVRTSGQVLCAYGAPNCGEGLGNGMMEVKQPEKRPEMNQFKTESSKVCGDNNYARSRECPLGHICHDLDLVCKFGRVHVRDSWFCTVQHDSTFVIKTIFDKVKSGITNDDEYDREFECKPVVMNKTWNANPEDECGGKDQLCYEDEYCYYDYESSSALHVEKSECRKLRYRLLDEPCFITDECVPGAVCHREAEYYLWGRCAPVSNYYQCPFRTRQNTCRVSRCPHGSEQQEGCVKPSKPEEAKCPMKTMRDYDRGNIPECAVDNGVIKFLKGCAEIFDFSKILDFTRGCAGTLFNVVKQNCCKP